jgi:hypothetical protein
MNKIFMDELSKQLEISKISKRKLSILIGKQETYIHQVLNDKIKNIDYIKAEEMFEQLDLIDNKLLDYYLYLLGVELPDKILNNVKNSNMFKSGLTIDQCYKNAWGTQEKINDEIENEDISNEGFKKREEIRSLIFKDEREYNSNYSYNKEKEMEETVKLISERLSSFIYTHFDPSDYSNEHFAEEVLTTLKGLFDVSNDNLAMFRFFLELMSIPLHTIKDINDQNDILNYIEKKCKYEYEFWKYCKNDNDPVTPNQLHLEPK